MAKNVHALTLGNQWVKFQKQKFKSRLFKQFLIYFIVKNNSVIRVKFAAAG